MSGSVATVPAEERVFRWLSYSTLPLHKLVEPQQVVLAPLRRGFPSLSRILLVPHKVTRCRGTSQRPSVANSPGLAEDRQRFIRANVRWRLTCNASPQVQPIKPDSAPLLVRRWRRPDRKPLPR